MNGRLTLADLSLQRPMIVNAAPAIRFPHRRFRWQPGRRQDFQLRFWLHGVALAVAIVWPLSALPASAQSAMSGSEAHSAPYAPSERTSRKKKQATSGGVLHHGWNGLVVDLAVVRPLNSRITISNGLTPAGQFNLTGIQVVGTAAYLFQEGHFVLGPRLSVMGGWVETMPLDYTIRPGFMTTFGAEAGITGGRLYAYGFGGGGVAWMSAERLGIARVTTIVPAYELGIGIRYALSQAWYVKTEISYKTIGDFRLGNDYFDPKPYVAITAGFGFRFSSR